MWYGLFSAPLFPKMLEDPALTLFMVENTIFFLSKPPGKDVIGAVSQLSLAEQSQPCIMDCRNFIMHRTMTLHEAHAMWHKKMPIGSQQCDNAISAELKICEIYIFGQSNCRLTASQVQKCRCQCLSGRRCFLMLSFAYSFIYFYVHFSRDVNIHALILCKGRLFCQQ